MADTDNNDLVDEFVNPATPPAETEPEGAPAGTPPAATAKEVAKPTPSGTVKGMNRTNKAVWDSTGQRIEKGEIGHFGRADFQKCKTNKLVCDPDGDIAEEVLREIADAKKAAKQAAKEAAQNE